MREPIPLDDFRKGSDLRTEPQTGNEAEIVEFPIRATDTPLARIFGADAGKYAEAWGIPLDDPDGRRLFDVTTKFMCLAHMEAESALPFSERIDLEAFALRYRPATYAETLRELAELIRREREGG
jgi:hypothetical protein